MSATEGSVAYLVRLRCWAMWTKVSCPTRAVKRVETSAMISAKIGWILARIATIRSSNPSTSKTLKDSSLKHFTSNSHYMLAFVISSLKSKKMMPSSSSFTTKIRFIKLDKQSHHHKSYKQLHLVIDYQQTVNY